MCCTFANLRTQANPVRMDQHPRPVLAVPFLFLATLILLVQEPLAHRVGELEGRDCAAEARRACWWCRTAGGEAAAVTAADAMSTDTPVGLDPVVRFCCRWDRPQPLPHRDLVLNCCCRWLASADWDGRVTQVEEKEEARSERHRIGFFHASRLVLSARFLCVFPFLV